MKTCGKCFRCCENVRDAEQKGLPIRRRYYTPAYSHKPRPGVSVVGAGIGCHSPMQPSTPACSAYHPRWLWNLRQRWLFEIYFPARQWWDRKIRAPIGKLRRPAPIEWEDYYDGMTDTIIKGGKAVCPHCGETPYGTEQCVFCGQRFVKRGKEANQDEFV